MALKIAVIGTGYGIGNGSAFGTGLGRGVANETGHLPERTSDSIFAVIAEEAGLIVAAPACARRIAAGLSSSPRGEPRTD